MADRKRSKVWLHFTKLDADNARCNICNAKCKREEAAAPVKRKKLSALGQLFEDEDQALLMQTEADVTTPSVTEKVKQELQTYRSFPAVLSFTDPLLWWWQKNDQMPMLASLAKKYLCVQASSTPSERVMSTAGNTVSVERARLLPEKVDMLMFLKKNC